MGGRRTRNASPLCTSQKRTVLSAETVTSSLPSGVNRTFRTLSVWPPVSRASVGLAPSWRGAEGSAGPLPGQAAAVNSTSAPQTPNRSMRGSPPRTSGLVEDALAVLVGDRERGFRVFRGEEHRGL